MLHCTPSPSANADPASLPCPPCYCYHSADAAIKLQEARRISRSRPPQIACIRFPCRVATACCCCCCCCCFLWSPSSPLLLTLFCCWSSLIASLACDRAPGVCDDDDMKPEAVAASKSVSRSSSSSTVAFSWEHEPGVSKQNRSDGNNKPAAGAPRAVAVSRRTPASAKKKAQPPAPASVTATAHRHRLRVPPPPGGPGTPAASPPGRTTKPRSSHRVKPADDPFLAAYLACTGDSANGGKKLLGWAGLGLGLGLGMRGLGLSCKTSCGALEDCVVRLAKIPGGLDED